MNQLIDAIESNKEQLTSGAYTELMNAAALLHKQLKPTYVIEVFFTQIIQYGQTIRSDVKRAEFIQTSLGQLSYEEHLKRVAIESNRSGFICINMEEFIREYLIPENSETLMQIDAIFTSAAESPIHVEIPWSIVMVRVKERSETGEQPEVPEVPVQEELTDNNWYYFTDLWHYLGDW